MRDSDSDSSELMIALLMYLKKIGKLNTGMKFSKGYKKTDAEVRAVIINMCGIHFSPENAAGGKKNGGNITPVVC